MSEKMTCPGCDVHLSDIRRAFLAGAPCPNCGLSAEAALQIDVIKASWADESVKQLAQEAIERADRAEAELRRLRHSVEMARLALDGGDRDDMPYLD